MKSSLVLLVCLGLASCALAGRTGLENGRLRDCPGSPNCVSSEAGDKGVEPLPVADDQGWERLRSVLTALGGRIESEGDGYLHATFRSRVFGFVDDVEFRREGQVVHVRSAARTGWWDMGVNRKRVERIRQALAAAEGN